MNSVKPLMMPRFCYLLAIIFIHNTLQAEIFDLGGMYTQHYHDGRYADWGKYSRIGAQIAINRVNESKMLGEDKLRMMPENIIDYHCWIENVDVMVKTLTEKPIIAITGAECSDPAVIMADLGALYDIPIISYGANASRLSSASKYPWFARVVSPSETYEGYLIKLVAHFNIKDIAYFHTTDAWGEGANRVVQSTAKKNNINIIKKYAFARDTSQTILDTYIKELKTLGIKHIVITTPTPDTVKIFKAIHKYGMNLPGNSLYAAELILDNEDLDAVNGSIGYFAPIAKLYRTEVLDAYINDFKLYTGESINIESGNLIYSALSYDHIMLIANTIKLIKNEKTAVNRNNIQQFMKKVNFEGASGNISFSPGSNDRLNMPIQIMNSHGVNIDGKMNFVQIAEINQKTGQLEVYNDKILWPGNTKDHPQ